ncbi:serine/arginine-rich splicing factor 4 [Calliphora vicina]|uniref:serine/arginine-rich splicing factor 4 n=1 Tax=Calliphora vicina TaxID=7373 RepID=UPI00325C0096
MQQQSNEELKECIMQYKTRLQEILQRLEWSEEAVVKDFNTNSLASAVKDNVKKPRSPKVATYPDSCITNNSLVIETKKLQEILQNNEVKAPRNFTELQANLSREQKLKIYEHVVDNTEKLKNNTVAQVDEGEISLADILAQKKREEKRNKRKFRKPKPTHIEEVRCLVDLQMQALQQFVGNKMKKDEDKMERSDKHSRISRDERKHYEDYYKRDKYRDRSVDDYRRRDRYRSKERKRFHRSRSKDISHKRKRRSRSHSRERRKHSPSCHKDIVHKRTNNSRSRSKEISKERRKHRSRSKERRKANRSSSKEVLYEKRKRSRSPSKYRKHSRSFSKEIVHKRTRHSRSHSKEIAYKRTRDSGSKEITKERFSQKEESFYSKKHSSRRDYENANEKRRHNEKLYRRHSKSPENSGSQRHSLEDKTKNIDYDGEYTSSHQSRRKQYGSSHDKDRQIKSAYQSTEETSKYKSYQHKSIERSQLK